MGAIRGGPDTIREIGDDVVVPTFYDSTTLGPLSGEDTNFTTGAPPVVDRVDRVTTGAAGGDRLGLFVLSYLPSTLGFRWGLVWRLIGPGSEDPDDTATRLAIPWDPCSF